MSLTDTRSALNQYQKAGAQSQLDDAAPHRLIQMLFEGALDKIATAKGHIDRKDYAKKAHFISWAVSIVNGLRMSLDKEAGGEIAQNLDALYDYMSRRLMEANSKNDTTILDEVAKLLREIKEAWDEISDEAK